MASFYGYNREKKRKGFSDIYVKAAILGLVIALFFIGGGIGIKFIVLLLIKYWIWVLVLLGSALVAKKFFFKGRPR